jgi:hypothetical protein
MQACKNTLFKTIVMSQLVKFLCWSNRSYAQIVYPTGFASQGGFNKYYTVWLYGARPPSNNQHFIKSYEFDELKNSTNSVLTIIMIIIIIIIIIIITEETYK